MHRLALISIALCGVALTGCKATPVRPEANRVIVTRQPAPKTCKFLGTVSGEQEKVLVGGWTSNKNLAQGAMNDLKNRAYVLGGNYVVLQDSHGGPLFFGSHWGASGAQADLANHGDVYRCNEDLAGL